MTEPKSTPASGRLLTFTSGGWVLLLAAIGCAVIMGWALAPWVLRLVDRPLGDGRTIESYGFDLAGLQVSRELVHPAMLYRDMIAPLDTPDILEAEVAAKPSTRNKLLVPGDPVIGVAIAGQARAYPISVLNVHEVVHDTLGDVPIAVTYNWTCDAVAVYDRRVDGEVLDFGVSGLVFNNNILLYDRNETSQRNDPPPKGESLWVQMLGKAVSGPRAGQTLKRVPAVLVEWRDWVARHPGTTVVGRDPNLVAKRYKGASPTQYFLQKSVLYPLDPAVPSEGPGPFERIFAVEVGPVSGLYAQSWFESHADDAYRCTDVIDGVELHFTWRPDSHTVAVEALDGDARVSTRTALWFAWHAIHPGATVRWSHGPLAATPDA